MVALPQDYIEKNTPEYNLEQTHIKIIMHHVQMEGILGLLTPRVLTNNPAPTLGDGGPLILEPELCHLHCQLSTILLTDKVRR